MVLKLSAVVLAGMPLAVAAQAGAVLRSSPSPRAEAPGYWLMTGYGSTYAFNAPYLGAQLQLITQSPCTTNGGVAPRRPSCVGISATADGQGYWIGDGGGAVTQDNHLAYNPGALPEGNTGSCTSATGPPSAVVAPLVGIAAAAVGAWLATADGGVFALCGAPFSGSMGAKTLNKPIVAMAATPDGGGYWLVAGDGGVFSFGDARYYGSMGAKPLDRPIVAMAATPDGGGYWLVASDGGVFAFGDAVFAGSMGGVHLNAPMVGIAADPGGTGYWTVAADGGVFSFGGAPFLGSAVGQVLDSPIAGITSKP